jgi:glycosyltransferase involved in cell wall biosynthesis
LEKIAYLSYDGLTDPLGQSQVLPYLKGLAQKGYAISIFSFEKKQRFKKYRSQVETYCREAGLHWLPLLYTKKPPVLSTLWDISRLSKRLKKEHRKEPFQLIHCRSYLTSLVGLSMKKKYGTGFLFDMRGYWADERVDGKLWNLGNPIYKRIFRYFKRKEKEFLQHADGIISLTQNGRTELLSRTGFHSLPVTVIPCCVDLALFDPSLIRREEVENKRKELGIANEAIVISYVGSTGTWYMLPEMLAFFKRLLIKVPEAILLFITQDDRTALEKAATEAGISLSAIRVQPATRNEVPVYLATSDYSLFFIKPVFSKIASSPTKQGEIMAMGKPVICNDNVGDTGYVVNKYRSGILLKGFDNQDYDRAIEEMKSKERFDPGFIRKGAEEFYSLEEGIRKYEEVYEAILKKMV